MNILFISREFPPSKRTAGIGTYTREISTGLVKRGHKVFVIAASDNIFKEYIEVIENVTVYRLKGGDYFVYKNILGKAFSKFRSIVNYNSYRKKVYKKILNVISEKKIDIIEIPEYGNEGKYWLKNKITPTLVRFHGPMGFNSEKMKFELKSKRLLNELLDTLKADAHSYVSKSMMKIIQDEPTIKLDFKKFKGKTGVIPNSISINSSNLPDKKKRNMVKILGAGTISKTKGWGELIEACRQLKIENIPVSLIIFGRFSAYKEELNERIKNNKTLSSIIELQGQVDKMTLYQQYANADICCFPSWYEPFGLTVIEAMSQGAIVIASNSGGGAEIIKHGINGFLITPKISIKLKLLLKQIIDLPENEKHKIRENAKKTVEDKFSNDVILKKVEDFYQSVISKS